MHQHEPITLVATAVHTACRHAEENGDENGQVGTRMAMAVGQLGIAHERTRNDLETGHDYQCKALRASEAPQSPHHVGGGEADGPVQNFLRKRAEEQGAKRLRKDERGETQWASSVAQQRQHVE